MSQDTVQQKIDKILNKIIKSYNLNEKEAEELKIATSNYDYEINDGAVITRVESIEMLFTEEDSEVRIYPTVSQLKAMAEYIRETEQYYILYGYEEFTEKVIDSILAKDENEITKLDLLQEMKNTIKQKIESYSEYSFGKAKAGFENEWKKENKKLILVEEMIREEKQKSKTKNDKTKGRER